jgi:hypothetical protein
VAYSSIRPKSPIFNIGHDYALWIGNFMVMMKKPENLDFETWPNGPMALDEVKIRSSMQEIALTAIPKKPL